MSSPNPEFGVRREIFEIHNSEMSRVFYAESTEGELIVVKSLHPDADEFIRERFVAEANILGALDHPQIPELLDDETDYLTPHIKMKPVMRRRQSPRDLAYLNSHPAPDFAAWVMRDALEPIGYVHDQGFIHRDIKPSNLILGVYGVALADFGAAEPRPYGGRVEEGSLEHMEAMEHHRTYGVSKLGRQKRTIGTLEYLSPEELRDEKPDITSDIYSAGTSLYELVYGRFAHSGFKLPKKPETPDSLRRDDLEDGLVEEVNYVSGTKIKKIPEGRVEEAIDLSPPEGRPVPGTLTKIIERATQVNPADRYQSAAEMQEDLDRHFKTKF